MRDALRMIRNLCDLCDLLCESSVLMGRATTAGHVDKGAVRQDNFSTVNLYPEISAASPGGVYG